MTTSELEALLGSVKGHSPGPWTLGAGGLVSDSTTLRQMVARTGPSPSPLRGKREANGRLIAAAPMLLEQVVSDAQRRALALDSLRRIQKVVTKVFPYMLRAEAEELASLISALEGES